MRYYETRGPAPTLVCCALGYSRSAIASAAWLMAARHAANAADALAQVRCARPQVIVGQNLELRLEQWAKRRKITPSVSAGTLLQAKAVV